MTKSIAISTAVGAVVAIATASVAFAADGPGFGRRFDGHRRGGMLLMLVLLGAVIALAVVLWRGRHPATPPLVAAPPASPTLNAQTILADRLARGEISPDDYRAAVSVLRETSPPA
jgi:putative membrane protein